MAIVQICKDRREETGMKNIKIAEVAGLSISTVNNFFASGSKNPSSDTVGNICRALGISLDAYYGIIDRRMGQQEIDRIKEEYEKYRAETQQTIDLHTQHAGHQNDMLDTFRNRLKWWKAAAISMAISNLLLSAGILLLIAVK